MVYLNGGTMLIYALLWLTILTRMSNGKVDKRTVRSLTVILTLILVGWVASGGICVFFISIGYEGKAMLGVLLIAGLMINLSVSLDFIVYYKLV